MLKCYTLFDRLDNHLAHKHLQRGTQEFKDLLATYYKQTKKLLKAEDTFSGQKVHNVHTLFNKIEKFNSGESEEDFPEKEASLKDSTNEPGKTEPAASKTRKKASASRSLEREKPGPSSYQRNEPGKTQSAASQTRKKTSASSSLRK